MKIRSFSEWADFRASIAADGEDLPEKLGQIECSECEGEGEIEDVGERTGRTFETECPTCDGDGYVDAADATDEQLIDASWESYEKTLKGDIEALAIWTRQDKYELLEAAGFVVLKKDSGEVYSCRLGRKQLMQVH